MKKFLSRYSFIGIIFLVVLFYILTIFFGNITKKNVKLYQVNRIELNKSINTDALILREEKLLSSTKEGYVLLAPNTLDKVGIDDLLFLVDTQGDFSKQISNEFTNKTDKAPLQQDNIKTEIESIILSNKNSDLRNISYLRQIINENSTKIIDNQKVMDYINKNNFQSLEVLKSDTVGLFLNSLDGYEGIEENDIINNIYPNKKYPSTFTLNNTKVSADLPFAKLVTSEDWSIIINIEYNIYHNLKDGDIINIYFNKTNDSLYGKLKLFTKNNQYYAKIDFTTDMIRYVQDRYTNIAINNVKTNGYLIPKTSLFTMDDKHGVLVANNGVAKFKEVKIIDENTSNYIISLDTKLKNFDLIVENAKNFKDGERLYK